MEPSTEPSNVVLIRIDSLRAEALGTHDPDRHTPVMDGIAESPSCIEDAEGVLNSVASIVEDHVVVRSAVDESAKEAIEAALQTRPATHSDR